MKKVLVLMCVALSIVACKPTQKNGSEGKSFKSSSGLVKVVATTGIVADLVKNVGQDRVEVTALMGPGVDPHLYKASAGDIAKLSKADIIFYNGLNLEGKMSDILVKMARHRPTIAVTETINVERLREPPEFAGHYDPHVWFNVSLWREAIRAVTNGLTKLDPSHKEDYQKNARAYTETLKSLHEWTSAQLANIPAGRRVLVTAHDAFGYFGRAYDIEVVGLQGISTVSEFGLADMERVVKMLVKRNLPAIFVESSIPKRSIEAVVAGAKAYGHNIQIGGELYSDALGPVGSGADTYEGMVRSNVNTIVKALYSKSHGFSDENKNMEQKVESESKR